MRVLLTGGSGFVGRQVLHHLARLGAEVHVISRRDSRTFGHANHKWTACDLMDARAVNDAVRSIRPACVLHLAWTVEHGAFWTAPENLDWIAASLTLAGAAADAGARRMVGVGTCYEYDWPDDADCDEVETATLPATLYASSKDGTRRALESFCATSRMEFAWARLFFMYGPGEGVNRLVPSVARALLNGEVARCSRGVVRRDFIDVRDAGAQLAALAVSDGEGAFNIASGESVTVADIANSLGAYAGRPDLVHLGALPDRPGEPARITASVRRIAALPGYAPPRPLAIGLADALRYWAANMAGEPTR